MHRRLPTILSVLLLLLVAALALFLMRRHELPPPQTQEASPPPAPPPPQSPAPTRPVPAAEREGLVGPGSIADALPDFQECYASLGLDEGLEPQPTLVFTVTVDPSAARPLARVSGVRVRTEEEQLDQLATPFEACLHTAVHDLELVPPGERDSLDIPMRFELGG